MMFTMLNNMKNPKKIQPDKLHNIRQNQLEVVMKQKCFQPSFIESYYKIRKRVINGEDYTVVTKEVGESIGVSMSILKRNFEVYNDMVMIYKPLGYRPIEIPDKYMPRKQPPRIETQVSDFMEYHDLLKSNGMKKSTFEELGKKLGVSSSSARNRYIKWLVREIKNGNMQSWT